MIIEPKVRGFICTTAHPKGCEKNVIEWMDYVEKQPTINKAPKNVLVIGASTGYGLASRIVAGMNEANTVGVIYEKEASDKRTASPGWYNTAAFEKVMHKKGLFAKTVNGDAFSNAVKAQTIALIKQDLKQPIDLVIYSLASPRRQDPNSDTVYHAVLKPIGKTFANKTVDVMNGKVSDIEITPASDEEIAHTVKVMGGEDWQLWIEALLEAEVLAPNCVTVAYSYIGPEITFPVYRQGTIGRAKDHLEKTGLALDKVLQETIGGHAYVSVNKGLVTQASAAIPVVPLYISSLYKVMKEHGLHEGCIEQIYRLFHDRLYAGHDVPLDEKNRIRLDDWEMRDDVQADILKIWNNVNTDNLLTVTDLEGYRNDFYRLFGFNRDDVDYNQDVNIHEPIPSVPSSD